MLSRIDRFYVRGSIAHLGGRNGIWPTLPHISDHAPIFIHFKERETDEHMKARFDNVFLSKDFTKEQMLGAWQSTLKTYDRDCWTNRINKAIQEVKIANDVLVKERAKNR